MVFEQATLYGLTLIACRRVWFAPVSRKGAREVFIRSGLVENGYVCALPFMARNVWKLARLRTVEHKLRSPGAVVNDDAVHVFYDARIPPRVADGRTFEEWFPGLDEKGARALERRRDDIAPGVGLAGEAGFSDLLQVDDQAFGLVYRFAPGEDDDGLTVQLPLDVVADLDPGRFEWLVPGMLGKDACTGRWYRHRSHRRRAPGVPMVTSHAGAVWHSQACWRCGRRAATSECAGWIHGGAVA